MPTVRGPLALKVVYPRAGAIVTARDSSFLLGSAGAGDAKLTINGAPVEVWPNGAWLAWVPLPADSLMQFRLVARTPRDSAELVYEVRRSQYFVPPDSSVWIDSTSLAPRGHVWLAPAKYFTLSARAAEGALVRLRLGDGTVVPFAADPRGLEVPAAVRAFDRDTLNLRAPVHSHYYTGVLRGRRVGADPGPILPATGPAFQAALQRTAATCPPTASCPFAVPDVWSSADTAPVLEAIRGADTARVRWPLELALTDTLPLIVELYPAQPQSGEGIVVGRAAPRASYHWFFPSGTRAVVGGRQNEQVELELSQGVAAWVAAADVRALPAGTIGWGWTSSSPPRCGATGPAGAEPICCSTCAVRRPFDAAVHWRDG